MQADSNWADRLRAGILDQIARQEVNDVKVESVRSASGTTVEIIFSVPGEVTLRGIRLDLSWAEKASRRFKGSDAEDLAFNAVHLGVLEPRSVDEFTVEDSAGVRWLATENWLED